MLKGTHFENVILFNWLLISMPVVIVLCVARIMLKKNDGTLVRAAHYSLWLAAGVLIIGYLSALTKVGWEAIGILFVIGVVPAILTLIVSSVLFILSAILS